MSVPSPWVALILVGAIYRIFVLLSDDVILDRPRNYLVRLPRDWTEEDPIPDEYRIGLANFIACPRCLGAHLTWVVWLLWEIAPRWTTILAFPLAAMAAVYLIALLGDRLS